MRILKVIHGYPMRYNAGSEVYSRLLANHLVEAGHTVEIFSRYECPFEPDYALSTEFDSQRDIIRINLVNMPRSKDRYRHNAVDKQFAAVLERFQPDAVHIGHLNHLSTSLVFEAKKREIPVVFTLHDYWMICPRGQFMQFNIGERIPWKDCDGQENMKCAVKCYSRYISGGKNSKDDLNYWASWVDRRIKHCKKVMDAVDIFLAPSQYLRERFLETGQIAENKILYMDYGFRLDDFKQRTRSRNANSGLTFGYIGRHTPAKGIHLLIEAFSRISGTANLKIWGRETSDTTPWLKESVNSFSPDCRKRIEWLPEYRNEEIVDEVFNHVDCLVVPSIWVENSPLVIHEAQQARLPVITSNTGGMAEYVRHGYNGLLFEHRNPVDLAKRMQELVDNSSLCRKLGKRGYLFSENGDIPDIRTHVSRISSIYSSLIDRRKAA